MLRSTLGRGGKFFEDGVDAPGQIRALAIEQTQARQQQQGMFGGGFRSSRS